MMRLLPLLFLFPLLGSGQSKQSLLNAIIKINRLETADKGPGSFVLITDTIRLAGDQSATIPDEYDNYRNFQALAKLITREELVALTEHKNGVVRMFAIRQLIENRDRHFDFFKSFLHEFYRHDSIESQFADMIDYDATHDIFLADLSGGWNYARSTFAESDSKFFNDITRSIDSFILFTDFNFHDRFYEDVFDRQKFEKSANARILELTKTKFNFWAFSYLEKYEPVIFDAIKNEVLRNVVLNRSFLFEQHLDFFEWFLRYMVTTGEIENAKQMIAVLNKDEYFDQRLERMLMGIDKKLVDKVK